MLNRLCYRTLLLALACLVLWSCNTTNHTQSAAYGENPVTTQEWQKLERQRIFFGHQSVGANILEGVRELAAENRANLNLVASAAPESINGPALIDARIGRNGEPISKLEDFSAMLSRGMGNQGGTALFKLCFSDVDGSTDADALFANYRERIAAIKSEHPQIRIVHVTIPLTAAEPRLKAFAKLLLRRTTEREINAKRNRFNDLLRREYGGRDPIFDLAQVESTHSDGARSFVGSETDPVFTLAPEYTDDGAHLNRMGRRRAAAAFIRALASVESDGQHHAATASK